jgi:hypothetical protein
MIAIGIIGLFVPGYALARALRVPFAWGAAFPLSALMIVMAVIAFVLTGAPVCFCTVAPALSIVTVAALAGLFFSRRSPRYETTEPPLNRGAKLLFAAVAVQVALVLVGLLVRTSMYPLSGPDTVYRWEGLARLMLAEQGLAHYPPLSAEDFTHYVYPDAIPPLVASVYWWLYAAWGAALPELTSVPVMLQAFSCFLLVYGGARVSFGAVGGIVALVSLASTPLFIGSVAIGQDTGYTALSYAGQLAFALAAVADPKRRYVVMAGLFGALGALTREYGLLLSLGGFAVLAVAPKTRRLLPLYAVTVAVVAAPWYVRVWMLTGNPLYPFDMLHLGLPTNAVHVELHDVYRELVGARLRTADGWAEIALRALIGGPVAIVLGIAGLKLAGRQTIGLAIAAVLALVAWRMALPFTLGGISLSVRMFAPVYLTLSIAAGACGPALARLALRRPQLFRAGIVAPIVVVAFYATLGAWSLPFHPTGFRTAVTSRIHYPDDVLGPRVLAAQAVAGSGLPDAAVLTDDSYLATALKRARVRPVMAWSPEVSFVFDPNTSGTEVRRRLREMNIHFVAPYEGNLPYLRRFPLYADDSKQWQQVRYNGEALPLFFLPE